ncbi:MAG: prefoldin subunit beta [DPANN group archaeon]|nr:prefoldin subunit beta [DPANN group archaeon]
MNSPEQQKKLQQLQMIEQNLTNLLMQRQQFQGQIAEVESALKELRGKDHAFKIIGNIMVNTKASDLTVELTHRKQLLEIRTKTLEKQEQQLKAKANQMQEDVLKAMKKMK